MWDPCSLSHPHCGESLGIHFQQSWRVWFSPEGSEGNEILGQIWQGSEAPSDFVPAAYVSNMWNWTYFLNKRHNCLTAGFLWSVHHGLASPCCAGWGSAGSMTLNIATMWWGKLYFEFIAGFGNCSHQLSPALPFCALLYFTLSAHHTCLEAAAWLWPQKRAHLPWAGLQPRSACSFLRRAVLWWLCFLSMEESRRVVIQWKEITVSWLTPCLRELEGSAWEKGAQGDCLTLYNRFL